MKETVKAIFLLVVIYLLLFFLVNTNRKSQTKQPEPKDIIISDTITNVVYDTTFLERYKTVKLPVDTTVYYIADTLTRVDSIFVEVPISVYELDTVFKTDTTRLDLFIQNSGYDVTLDTLSYKFTYTPTPPVIKKKRHRFGFFVGPAVGVGYDYLNNKPIPTVGIGIGVGWTLKKY